MQGSFETIVIYKKSNPSFRKWKVYIVYLPNPGDLHLASYLRLEASQLLKQLLGGLRFLFQIFTSDLVGSSFGTFIFVSDIYNWPGWFQIWHIYLCFKYLQLTWVVWEIWIFIGSEVDSISAAMFTWKHIFPKEPKKGRPCHEEMWTIFTVSPKTEKCGILDPTTPPTQDPGFRSELVETEWILFVFVFAFVFIFTRVDSHSHLHLVVSHMRHLSNQ